MDRNILELELSPNLTPLDRALSLIDWMYEDFIFAGPAALFAAMYFAPGAPKKGLFKRLRSENREEALSGIRNAAWDITQLSDFVLRVSKAEAERRRYIFASGDLNLARLASMLFLGPVPADGWPSLTTAWTGWWREDAAKRLSDSIFECVSRLQDSGRPLPSPSSDFIDAAIAKGEAKIRNWRNSL